MLAELHILAKNFDRALEVKSGVFQHIDIS